MAASMVVVLEPGRQSVGALLVAGEDLSVRPFDLQGPVEPFDLATLPGAVRADEQLRDAVARGGITERVEEEVLLGVVGDDLLAGDAMVGEEVDRAGQELGAGDSLEVGVDLGVGQAGVVIDR